MLSSQINEAKLIGFVSPDDKWKVFRSVHSYPSCIDDITVEADMSQWSKTFLILTLLETEGLVVIHSEVDLEWRLADV